MQYVALLGRSGRRRRRTSVSTSHATRYRRAHQHAALPVQKLRLLQRRSNRASLRALYGRPKRRILLARVLSASLASRTPALSANWPGHHRFQVRNLTSHVAVVCVSQVFCSMHGGAARGSAAHRDAGRGRQPRFGARTTSWLYSASSSLSPMFTTELSGRVCSVRLRSLCANAMCTRTCPQTFRGQCN